MSEAHRYPTEFFIFMSEFQKSFAKATLAKLPPISDLMSHDDGWAEDASSASSASSTGTLVPSPTKQLFARPKQSANSSLTWTDFFVQELFLPEEVNDILITHHVYLTPPTDSGPLFVMHHGAGSSGMSFAICADEIRKILPKAGVLSVDARSHGQTMMNAKIEEAQDSPSTEAAAQEEASGRIKLDLSLETLSRDLVYVIRQTQSKMGWENLPDIVLVGHSLGGAVITDVANKGELGPKVLAYAVLDVVEGMS